MGLLSRLLSRSSKPVSEAEYQVKRYKKRQALIGRITKAVPLIVTALLVVGYSWLLLLPVEELGRETFIDENAIQPGQATVRYDWDSVHIADRYLDQLEALVARNASSSEVNSYLVEQFSLLGLPSASQDYTFQTSLHSDAAPLSGTNVWASFTPPRTSGVEAIVLAASWESLDFETRVEGGRAKEVRRRNLRGVATVLSMAEYLRGTNHYARTIVFVISDHHLDGMQAFLSAYHGEEQSNLIAGDLTGLQTGVIWTALCVDYPGHSFSHLGLYFEGTNGRLPNQDVLNTVSQVARHNPFIPIRLYQQPFETPDIESLSWFGRLEFVKKYIRAAKGLGEHWKWAGLGRSSGVHGVFLQYRIDALTVFAIPSSGPHGFHSLGRLLEGSLRAFNNLLERLHASLFFYLYLRPDWFTKVGSYLPAGVLIGAAITIRGLGRWKEASLGKRKKKRPVLKAGTLVLATHAVGGVVFWVGTKSGWFASVLSSPMFNPTTYLVGLIVILLGVSPINASTLSTHAPSPDEEEDNLPLTLSVLTHLELGAIIPTLSMLNFPQATLLSILLVPPILICSPTSPSSNPTPSSPPPSLTTTSPKDASTSPSLPPPPPPPTQSPTRKLLTWLVLAMSSPVGIASALTWVYGGGVVREGVKVLVLDWELLGNWTWIGIWVVWWSIWAQVGLAALI